MIWFSNKNRKIKNILEQCITLSKIPQKERSIHIKCQVCNDMDELTITDKYGLLCRECLEIQLQSYFK